MSAHTNPAMSARLVQTLRLAAVTPRASRRTASNSGAVRSMVWVPRHDVILVVDAHEANDAEPSE